MVKQTQTIRQQIATNCLSVFDHFAGLAFKEIKTLTQLSSRSVISHRRDLNDIMH